MATAAAIAGTVVSAGVGLYGAKKSADAQEKANAQAGGQSQAALAEQRRIFDTVTEQNRGGREVGGQALNSLAVMFGLQPALPEGVSPTQAINAQIARETPAGQAPQAITPQTQFGSLNQIPQDVVARYESIARQGNFKRQSDLSERNKANRQAYDQDFTALRAQYPGLAELDGRLQIDPIYQRSAAGSPAGRYAGGGFDVTGGSAGYVGGVQGTTAASAPTGTAPSGTAALSDAPVGGAETQLQSTGFYDKANQPAPTQEGVLQSLRDFPVSRFLQEEGMRGIQGSAAARGNLQSGRTLKALSEFNQNLAQAQAVQPFMSGLQGLAGVGQNANAQQQNNATNVAGAVGGTGNNLANLALQQGQNKSSAFQDYNNIAQGTLSNAFSAFAGNPAAAGVKGGIGGYGKGAEAGNWWM